MVVAWLDSPVLLTLGAALGRSDAMVLFLSLALLVGAARLLGELVRRFNQPAVLGEILAGILLGPTILGRLKPEWFDFIFPAQGQVNDILGGMTMLAVTLFLFVAGLELDLAAVRRQGRSAAILSVSGVSIPFALGFAGAWAFPRLLGSEPDSDRLIFALFFATAMAISALPVIIKTLMDLNLYRTDLGMMLVAAAIVDDLTGWIIFAVVLGLMGASAANGPHIGHTIALTLGYTLAMLTIGRWLIHRCMPFIQAYLSWPGGIIGFTLGLALLGAAFTEWVGIHSIFGAFIVGVAVGDSVHLRERTRATLSEFIAFFFAPLFFASIGLRVDFLREFDPLLVLVVLVIACAGKVLGCSLAGRLVGLSQREAWALGFGMNARGAMEIILGLLALHYGLISERLFVALVIMALATSIMSGPIMARLLRRPSPRRFSDFLSSKCFLPHLSALAREGAIAELSKPLAAAAGRHVLTIQTAVLEREQMMGTGLANGIAVPHARIHGIDQPLVAMGLSPQGIDFDAADGSLTHIVFVILTPIHDDGAQLNILADIARTFKAPDAWQKVVKAQSLTQFLALLRSDLHHETQTEVDSSAPGPHG